MHGLRRGFVVVLVAGIVALSGTPLLAQGIQELGNGYPAENWPFAGGDWTSSRHSTLSDITTDNIGRLGGAWVARLPGGVSSRATPVVDDGVLYLTGGASVLAIDGRSGGTVWRWEAGRSADGTQRVPSWQGVGLGDGLVFVGLRSAEVAAPAAEFGRAGLGGAGGQPAAAGRRVGHHGADVRAGHGLRGAGERRQRRAGARHRPRRGDRGAALDVLRGAAAGGVRPRDLAAGLGSVAARRGRRLAGRRGRSRPRAGLLRHRQSGPDVRRRDSRGRQPVHRVGARARHGDRRAAVALPGGPARHLGRGHRHTAVALRDRDRGAHPQGAGRDAGRRLPLPVRPRDGRADRADRGPAGAAGRPPAHRAHPALPVRREHPSVLLLLARQGAAAVRAELQLLHAAVAGPARRRGARCADSDGAGHADVVQSADRIHLRAGAGARRTRVPLRGPVDIGQSRQRLCPPHAAGVDRHSGCRRRADRRDRLEERVPWGRDWRRAVRSRRRAG